MLKRRKLLSVILALCMVFGSYSKAPAAYAAEAETTKTVVAETAESMEASMEAIAEEITKALEEDVTEAGVTEYLNSAEEEETEEPTLPETKEEATQAPETEPTKAPETEAPAVVVTSEDTVKETAEPETKVEEPAVQETEKAEEPEETKAEEPEDTKAEEPEETKAEEPEETKAEEPEETKAEEPEETKAEEPEETKAEEPEEPQTEEPEAPEEKTVLYSAYLEQVTVTVSAKESAFDEDVRLVVTPLAAGSDEYKDAEEALVNEGKVFDGMMAFDISFVSVATGEEVEPNGTVAVKMTVNKKALADLDAAKIDTDSMTVSHITEDAVEDVADVADETDGQVTVNANEAEMMSIKAEFEVEGLSPYVITWKDGETEKTFTVHWGIDTEDGFEELTTPSTIDSTASSVDINIIIDAEKYYFIGADYKLTADAEEVENLKSTVLHNSDGWTMELEESGTVAPADGSHIYVHYLEYSEGHPYTPPTPPTPDVLAPDTEKTVTDNGDGTYKIRLDIEGKSDHSTTKIGANVIVIMDITQSMSNNMSGGSTRMEAAKTALTTLINTLDPDTNLINFRAINFGDNRYAYDYDTTGIAAFKLGVNWTTSKSAMLSYANGLPGPDDVNDFGTCWQAALRGGYEIVTEEVPANNDLKNNATYVVFVTDGNPNCYTANNDGTGSWTGASGPGYNATAYSRAAYWADLLGPECEFYGVYCGNRNDSGYGYLEQLIQNANGTNENFINGTSTSAIEEAFQNIAQTIVNNLGAGGVTVDDGIPTLSNVSANVTAGEAGGFKYYIKPAGGTEVEWTKGATSDDDPGAPGATYSNTNGVTWDLGEAGELKNGWIYTVEFTVWPSQAAYDLIADLNNGLKDWDDLTDEQKASVDGDKEHGYTLKTNTHLYTNFTDLEGNTYQETNDARPSAMDLPTTTLTIIKDWNNEMDAREATDVTLTVTKDGENYLDVEMGEPVKTGDHTWRQSPDTEIYISYGQIVGDEVKETGHEYTVVEPANFSYRWDLTADIYRPMIIDGVKKVLILTDDPTGTEGTDYYTIDNKTYQVTTNNQNVLSATNDRRSNLAINKLVSGTGAPADAVFGFEITLDDVNGNHPGDDAYSDWYDTIWFAVMTDPTDRDTVVKEGITVEGATPEEGDTGFYWFDNGGTVTVYIHADEYIVFTNIARDAEYTVTELLGEDMPDGFQFVNATSAADNKAGGVSTPAEISDNVAEGTIDQSNTDYSVTYNNKYEKKNISFTKEWVDENDQDGIRPDTEAFADYLSLLVNGTASTDYNSSRAITDNEDGTYTITYSNVPVYINNETAVYTLEESAITDYTTTGSPAAVGETITNTHEPETMDITATKTWDDNENQDGKRDDVTFILYANGKEVANSSKTISKTATGDALTVKWEKVPINANGQPIEYSVKEDGESSGKITMNGAEYTVTYGGDAENGFTVKNSHTPEETEISATKQWDDNDNQDGKRDDVTFVLLADGEAIEEGAEKTIAKDATGDGLTVTWTGLPVYKNGTAIEYTVEEQGVENGKITMNGAEYTVTVSGDAEEGFTIKNSYTPEETEVKATKQWDDADNQDGKRDDVTFDLYANGTKLDGKSQTIAKDAEGDALTVTWTGLPVYEDGEEIEYTVKEAGVEDGKITMNGAEYTVTVSGDAEEGFTIKNSHTPEETEVSATKEWDDNNNQDGKRDNVTFVLLADGEPIEEGAEKTIAKDATGDALTVTWTNLPVYKAGTAIEYTVEEKGVEDGKITMNEAEYTVTVSGDAENGFTIKNSHTPEQTQIEVVKEWAEGVDAEGENVEVSELRPEKITVTMVGTADGKQVYTQTKELTEESDWKALWDKLDVYSDGNEIEYSVNEVKVDDYTVSVHDLAETETGYEILLVNTHDTDTLEVSKTVTSPAESDHERTYEIKITLDPAVSGTFTASGVEDIPSVAFENGVATVNLKDGDTLTIEGLPTTVEATIEETNPGSQYETPVLDPEDGVVTIGEDAAVEVQNERKTGDIKITKTVVSSTDADHDKVFTFTITLPDEEGATVNGDFEAAGVEGITTVTFTDGEATVELKDGDTLTIKGLPVGVDYEVAEEEADQGGFVTTKANDEGDIKASEAADVKFTNTRSEGSLIIHKSVVSDLPADKDPEETKYTITITLDDTSITNKYGNVQFTDGVATVELGHDESVTIKGLPADIGYTVSEEAPENFEEPEIEGAEGTIVKDDTKKADVKNTRKTGDLTITKTVESVFAADKEKSFEFTITLDPAIEAKFDTVDGEGTEGSITFDENGVATVTLEDGESLTIKGLPVTVEYTVEETEDPEFETTKTGDTGEITAAEAAEAEGEGETEDDGETTEAEGTKAEFTNTRKTVEVSVEKVWEDEDNKYKKQPESITVKLMADGKAYKDENGDEVTTELNANNEWKYTFEDLPEVVGTKTVKYTVEEDMETVPAGYTNKVTGSAENGFTITNTFKPVDTDPPVGKVVVGDEPAEPKTFKFTFKATSSDPEPPMPEKTEIEIVGEGMEEFGQFWFTEPGTYEYEIAEVKEDAEGYTYDATVYKLKYEITVGEDNELVKKMYVNGKEVEEFEQDTIQFENKYKTPSIDLTVNKIWEDSDDEWDIRPASITVQVLDGDGNVVKEALLTEMKGWTYTFKDLDKYDKNGDEIQYTVTDKVAGYDPEAGELTEEEEGVYSIELTNTLKKFKSVEEVVTVKKEIKGKPDKTETFEFELKATGDAPMPEGVKNGTLKIKGAASSQLTFTFDEPGTYKYTLKEVNTKAKNYEYDTTKYELVFTVTANTKTEKLEVKLTINKKTTSKVTFTNKYNPPFVPTGDDTNMAPWAVAMATSAMVAGTGVVVLKKRRKEEEEA